MEYLYMVFLYFPVSALFFYIRFKLSLWEDIVTRFESVKRPELKPIYGFWSEFRRTPKSYPIGNQFLKVAATNYGLYLQYDLKYEIIKFYKPVLIPWANLKINDNEDSGKKGFVEYVITDGSIELGKLYFQVPISDQIISEISSKGIQLISA